MLVLGQWFKVDIDQAGRIKKGGNNIRDSLGPVHKDVSIICKFAQIVSNVDVCLNKHSKEKYPTQKFFLPPKKKYNDVNNYLGGSLVELFLLSWPNSELAKLSTVSKVAYPTNIWPSSYGQNRWTWHCATQRPQTLSASHKCIHIYALKKCYCLYR